MSVSFRLVALDSSISRSGSAFLDRRPIPIGPPFRCEDRLRVGGSPSQRNALILLLSKEETLDGVMGMEPLEVHRGRLIDHIQLVVRDLSAAKRFYSAVLDALGVPVGGSGDDYLWADELFISTADSADANGELTGRAHIAFQADSRERVHRFYEAALAAGGRDNGAPGERSYRPGYYAAFVLDPDGNNIEAVYYGDARRSAASVRVTL